MRIPILSNACVRWNWSSNVSEDWRDKIWAWKKCAELLADGTVSFTLITQKLCFAIWGLCWYNFFNFFWCWLGALGSWGIEHLLGLAWNKLEGVGGEDAVPPPNACELRCNGCKLTGSYGSRVLVLLYLVDLLLLLLLLLTKAYKSKSSRRKNQQKQQQAARNKKLIPQTTPQNTLYHP